MLIKLLLLFTCGISALVLYTVLAVLVTLSMASELPDLEDIEV